MNLKKIYMNTIIHGDSLEKLKELPSDFVDLVITSPPYFQQRDYGNIGIGNEKTVDEYVENLMLIFKECVRVTKPTGSIVFNIGDKYVEYTQQRINQVSKHQMCVIV